MFSTHAVGIDLGTTYSAIACLNEHGEPVTISNQEGELSTPSVVLFDGDEVVVGTEALRNAIVHPDQVVQNSKRYMGDLAHHWVVQGKPYSPVDIATFILKKLISAAQERLGPVEQAVITVPAQFSDAQRRDTIEAGHRAGLKRVDIINEPVAAALCYVLGTEGLWFAELAEEQRILVFDLGGGTFDLSMVRYRKNEVSVVASSGDLRLGGIDWNSALQEAIADQFTGDFGVDPREDAESLQALALEVEQTKRSLSVRPRAALCCQHSGCRKVYQVQQEQFEQLSKSLVDKTAKITKALLKDNRMGWAHVDVVLTIGGASRMPMIRHRLKEMSGRTLNTSLSPDLSIAHGASYYAGMLLSNDKFARSILNPQASERLAKVRQRGVNARGLGILVRDTETDTRVANYLIEANTPLPASCRRVFGTVVPNQRRVHLQIIESGTSAEKPHVKLGDCVINNLPPDLPEGSQVAVTIRYDEQARVHVAAREVVSGKAAHTEIIRQENLVPQLESDQEGRTEVQMIPPRPKLGKAKPAAAKPQVVAQSKVEPRKVSPPPASVRPQKKPTSQPSGSSATAGSERKKDRRAAADARLESTDIPIPLCNECGTPLESRGRCPACGAVSGSEKGARKPKRSRERESNRSRRRKPAAKKARQAAQSGSREGLSDEDVLDFLEEAAPAGKSKSGRKSTASSSSGAVRKGDQGSDLAGGEEEFWDLVD